MSPDEEKRGLLRQQEEDEMRHLVGNGVKVSPGENGIKETTRGLKRSAAVMSVWLAAVALATLLVVTTMHGLCGRHHHHQEQQQLASSRVAEPSDTSAMTVDDGRYVHVVPIIPGEEKEEEGGNILDAVLLKRAGGKAGTPAILRRQSTTASAIATSTATTSSAIVTGTVLVDFQVHQPVLTPDGATLDSGKSNGEAGDVQDSCQVLLMDHVFAYSYGEPYIGEFFSSPLRVCPPPLKEDKSKSNAVWKGTYEPPPCEFNRVEMVSFSHHIPHHPKRSAMLTQHPSRTSPS